MSEFSRYIQDIVLLVDSLRDIADYANSGKHETFWTELINVICDDRDIMNRINNLSELLDPNTLKSCRDVFAALGSIDLHYSDKDPVLNSEFVNNPGVQEIARSALKALEALRVR